MARELTVKQKKFVINKAKGMTGAEAAREAGYSPKAAKETASENLTKPNIREAFLKAMEKAGITDERLSQVLDEGLNATVFTKVGELPDHTNRHKFFDSAAKIKGVNAPQKLEATITSAEDFFDSLEEDDEETSSHLSHHPDSGEEPDTKEAGR